MSELEREELTSRIKGMSEEELTLTASVLPLEVLADELKKRLMFNEQKLRRAAQALR